MQLPLDELFQRGAGGVVLALLRIANEDHVTHFEVRLAGAEVMGLLELQIREDRHLVGERLVGLERSGELLDRFFTRHSQPERQGNESHGRRRVLSASAARAHFFQEWQAHEHATGASQEGTTRKSLSHGALPSGKTVLTSWLCTTAETMAAKVPPLAR